MPSIEESKRGRRLLIEAEDKLEQGLPLTLDERFALNYALADDAAKEILAHLREVRNGDETVVKYTQGNFTSSRLAIELIMSAVYALSAQHADKRQKIEADVAALNQRIVDLQERIVALEEAKPSLQGTYNPTKVYRNLDQVALNGASFMAKRDNPGPCPGDGWQLVAAQGKIGKPGPRVKSLSVDGEGMLTLTNADGSTVSCDLYPILRKVEGA